VNPDSLPFDRVNQNGAMHRFDAFSGTSLVKTTGKKYNMQFANASSMRT
jgi:hypothetical protein